MNNINNIFYNNYNKISNDLRTTLSTYNMTPGSVNYNSTMVPGILDITYVIEEGGKLSEPYSFDLQRYVLSLDEWIRNVDTYEEGNPGKKVYWTES